MNNDEGLYQLVQVVANLEGDYTALASIMLNDYGMGATPDGVKWDDPQLDVRALSEAIHEVYA